MNVAHELLEELAAHGVRARTEGDELVLRGPGPVIKAALARVREHKAELLELLRSPNASALLAPQPEGVDWYSTPAHPPALGVGRPVDETAIAAIKAGRAVRVWSSTLDEWLVWVRDEDERARVLALGCSDVIYTLGELAVVADGTREDVRNLHALKRELGATIQTTTSDHVSRKRTRAMEGA